MQACSQKLSVAIYWCFFARARREGIRLGLKEVCRGFTQCCEAKEWIAQAPRIYMLSTCNETYD